MNKTELINKTKDDFGEYFLKSILWVVSAQWAKVRFIYSSFSSTLPKFKKQKQL